MKKLIVFILAALSFHQQINSMAWLKSLFSAQEREKQAVKKTLNLDMNGPHANIVGRDAIKNEISLNHLKIYIQEICQRELDKNEKSIGTVFQAPSGQTITITNHTAQKYAFQVRSTTKAEQTVCDKDNYVLYSDKAELLKKAAEALAPNLNPEAIKRFSVYLDRIAINRKIDEIKSDRFMSNDEKIKNLEAAIQERKALN